MTEAKPGRPGGVVTENADLRNLGSGAKTGRPGKRSDRESGSEAKTVVGQAPNHKPYKQG